MKPKMNTRELTKMALCTALLCVSSYLSFPIPFTPIVITAQTLIVTLIGLVLSPASSFFSVLVFILLGCVGLPVFSGGTGGLARLVGPTGGFILGFLAAAPLISLTKGKKVNIARYILSAVLLGMVVIDLCGTLMFSVQQQINAAQSFSLPVLGSALTPSALVKVLSATVIPFIPGDLIKCALASAIGAALNKVPGFRGEAVKMAGEES